MGGGKGGVGKSLLAANLAVAIAQRGQRVMLVDGDLGMANLHTLFGIERPGPGLQALISREVADLGQVAVPTVVPNLTLIPGSYAASGAANIGHAQKQKLIRHLRGLDTDVVVIDIGAGVTYNTLDLFDAADLRIVVMTSQVTSIQNGYGFLKNAVFRVLAQATADQADKEIVEAAIAGAGGVSRTRDVIERVRAAAPAVAERMDAEIAHFAARIIGNTVSSDSEHRIIQSIGRMVRDFLGLHATVIGTVPISPALHASVNARLPLLAIERGGDAGTAIRDIARALMAENVDRIRRGREGQLLPARGITGVQFSGNQLATR